MLVNYEYTADFQTDEPTRVVFFSAFKGTAVLVRWKDRKGVFYAPVTTWQWNKSKHIEAAADALGLKVASGKWASNLLGRRFPPGLVWRILSTVDEFAYGIGPTHAWYTLRDLVTAMKQFGPFCCRACGATRTAEYDSWIPVESARLGLPGLEPVNERERFVCSIECEKGYDTWKLQKYEAELKELADLREAQHKLTDCRRLLKRMLLASSHSPKRASKREANSRA